MAVAKKGLGRGLSALIPDNDMEFLSRVARGENLLSTAVTSTKHQQSTALGGDVDNITNIHDDEAVVRPQVANNSQIAGENVVEWVNISEIEANPYQPRRTFSTEEMQELVNSVRDHGILQPILVRPLQDSANDKRFQLVAGERRWRAAKEAGLARVPAVIRVVADQQALELALIENVQRHDISAVDAAMAYRRLASEFSLSQEEIARRVGKSRSAVANTLRLLDLPEEAQKAIDEGLLSEGHGRAILLADTDGARRAVFRHILRDRLSVRDAEHMARRATEKEQNADGGDNKKDKTKVLSAELSQVEDDLRKALGTKVKLRPKSAKSKSGQIVIDYFSDEDLNRLYNLLLERK